MEEAGKTKQAWQQFLEAASNREREKFLGWYERSGEGWKDYRNGYYERDFVTWFGTLRLRIARTRGKSFLPVLERLQRRVPEVALLIREAFLRGISTRQVGRVVAYGVRTDGSRRLRAFLRSPGESHPALRDWEGLLEDLYRRGLKGQRLALIVTDGCPGLAAAIQTVYPRVLPSTLLSMSGVWIASSMPSSPGSTRIGRIAPSAFLHRQLDITLPRKHTRKQHTKKTT